MGGPRHCCIRGCHSRHKPGVEKQDVQFYKLPSATDTGSEPYEKLGIVRRKAWLAAIKDSMVTSANLENIRICSRHFASGKKASLKDRDSPDWVPHLHLTKHAVTKKTRLPRCMACQTSFENSEMLMRHMEAAHTTTTCPAVELLTIQDKMYELIRRLKLFDWCSCDRCRNLCEQFFDHISSHVDTEQTVDNDHAYTGSNRENNVGDVVVEEKVTSGVENPPGEMVEYQCAACGNIYKSKTTVDRCLKRHVDNQVQIEEEEEITGDSYILSITPINADYLDKAGDDHVPTEKHLDVMSMDADAALKCWPCNTICPTVDLFRAHVSHMHGENFLFFVSDSLKVKQTISCTLCPNAPVAFDTLVSALAHRYEQHRLSSGDEPTNNVGKRRMVVHCDGTATEMTAKDVRLSRQNGIEEKFVCICGLQSSQRQVVDKCMAQHHGIRRFKCVRPKRPDCDDPCGMEFFTIHEINDHDRRIHLTPATDVEMEICPVCGMSVAKRAMGLHRHAHKLTNTGPQTCEMCGKTMASVRRLREHVRRVHKKVKKFMCPICFAGFVYRSSADLCAAKHTGVRSVHCECGKSFLTKAQRSAHRLLAHKV